MNIIKNSVIKRKHLDQSLFSGFTLVEMLVATAIFTSVMVVATGALISIINANNKAEEIKSVVDNVTFAVDSISRNLREGTNYACLNYNYTNETVNTATCNNGGQYNGIAYLNPSTTDTYTEYIFVPTADAGSGGNIQEATNCPGAGGCDSISSFESITAPTNEVNISNMAFTVFGNGSTEQPRVLISANGVIAALPTNGASTTNFEIQTTASQRPRSG